MEAKKILIVEDSEIQTVVLKRILEEKGYEVLLAKNGAEGLAIIRENSPDLILSDILMPVMDGYQMCRELKNDETLRKIPTILLTQMVDTEDVIRGLESGVDHYLTKPFDEEYLLKKVALLLKNPGSYRNDPTKMCIEFEYDGKRYEVYAGRIQTFCYLISTYENAILKNIKLIEAEEKLKEKFDMAERMNKLMVGRELKMEELRKRIKELEAQVAGLKQQVTGGK